MSLFLGTAAVLALVVAVGFMGGVSAEARRTARRWEQRARNSQTDLHDAQAEISELKRQLHTARLGDFTSSLPELRRPRSPAAVPFPPVNPLDGPPAVIVDEQPTAVISPVRLVSGHTPSSGLPTVAPVIGESMRTPVWDEGDIS